MPMRSVPPVDPAVRIRALKQMLEAGEPVPSSPAPSPAMQHGYFDAPPPTDLMLEHVGPSPQFPTRPLPVDEEMQQSGPVSGTWRKNDRTPPRPPPRARVGQYFGRG